MLKGEKIYFGSWFHRFQYTIAWPGCFGACGEAKHFGRNMLLGISS
jgi:hypothetical protein